jgi:hypothetical protein
MPKHVVIESFNPYEARFPKRTVISREELHLIKTLRANNIDYEINTPYKDKIFILSQKNFETILNDPIFLTIYTISLNVLAGFIVNAIGKNKTSKNKIYIKNKHGEVFNYEGTPIEGEVIKSVTKSMISVQQGFADSLSVATPFKDLPVPVHLEHTPKVVGWCNLVMDNHGLKVDPMKVTCDETWSRIRNGILKGFSIGGLISESKCTICDSNYVDCNHITGCTYSDEECLCQITEFDLVEVSIVKSPAQPLAGINVKKI